MAQEPGLHNLQSCIASKIRSLFSSLPETSPEYDRVAPKIEFWIDYVLREGFMTVDELVEGVSWVPWDSFSWASAPRFLKEFRDVPHRSEQAKSFVDRLCEHILRWFAIASTENLLPNESPGLVARCGGNGFIRAAAFIGYLIKQGLLSHDLVRRHLVKPLIAHHPTDRNDGWETVRANAINQLFLAAGNILLRGLLEPEDVQVCFEMVDAQVSLRVTPWLDAGKLKEFRGIHATWLEEKEKERQIDTANIGAREDEDGEGARAAEVLPEFETPVAFVPQDLSPAAIGVGVPSPILHDVGSSSNTSVNTPATVLSSPTLSISTVSDLTPTELGEEIEHSEKQMTARHDTFYFEDGNVEIVCGGTLFRVHSTTVSFSSPKLRDLLSSSALVDAPMPGGCPRISSDDSAEDFAVLLKMIHTPGFPARKKVPEFSIFASLLRMVMKYDFSDVREHLFEDLRSAYPTKWEDFEAAKVLGEGVFGSPKPHPNAVLNLFVAQSVRFAIPFAAYRASLDFPALISDKPGTVLPRLTLASTIYGMEKSRSLMIQVACTIVHTEHLPDCTNRACVLNVGTTPMKRRTEAMAKLHDVMISHREGGVLTPPSLGDIACAKCTKAIEAAHAIRRRAFWEMLPIIFLVAKCWDEV